jgi:hypothetical protein
MLIFDVGIISFSPEVDGLLSFGEVSASLGDDSMEILANFICNSTLFGGFGKRPART